MKITNFVLVFLISIFAYYDILNTNVQELSIISSKYPQYNNAVDTAIDAAVSSSIESANGISDLSSNFDGCVDKFYNSLFASFNAADNEVLQQDLQLYTPVLALADVDGFYILYNDTDKDGKLTKVKTQKFPYIAEFDEDIKGNPMSYTINVTLGDEVTVTFADDKNIYNGNYSELAKKYPKTHLDDVYEKTVLSRPGSFIDWKNHVISEAICEQLNHYIQRNNTIASDFGIKYNFTLPESASTELTNGISDITFIALFQGYPYGAGTKSVYNKFCVSGARVDKIRAYYVRPYKDGNEIHYYYHKYDCKKMLDSTITNDGFYETNDGLGYAFSSAKEAAASGALPCPYCCE